MLQQNNKTMITLDEKEQALRNINFYVGGLSDEGIEYYYQKMVNSGKIDSNG